MGSFWENPYVELHARRLRSLPRLLVSLRADLPRRERSYASYHRLALLFWAGHTAIPYLAPGIASLVAARIGHTETAVLAARLVGFFALLVAVGTGPSRLSAIAGETFARWREHGTLDQVLLTRLSPAEIVEGRAGMWLLGMAFFPFVPFPVWAAFPPFPSGDYTFFRLTQGAREIVFCAWADALALTVAGVFVGVAVSACCRTARAASVAANALLAVPVVFCCPYVSVILAEGFLTHQPPNIGRDLHVALWLACALTVPVAFLFAQRELDPMARRVRLLPGLVLSAPVSRGFTRALAGTLLGAYLLGALWVFSRAVSALIALP